MSPIITVNGQREIYSVTKLNQQSRLLLEAKFNAIWVEGEVSNCIKASSGHYYFTLKDSKSQIRCAFFKHRSNGLTFTLEDGLFVVARAKVSLYEARGDYQLIVDGLEPAGLGLLQKQFDALKQKLASYGLFDSKHKKNIPSYPKTIAVITSSHGAAIKDILTTLKRRFAPIGVLIYPTEVQGVQAAKSIVKALKKAIADNLADAIIIARGGGSLEDLWAFNDETLAQEMFHCEIPIVTGIGHEIDFTIADFVADLRAPTPTAAAEALSPHWQDIYAMCIKQKTRLQSLMNQKLDYWQLIVKNLQQRLTHPTISINALAQKLDNFELQLHQSMKDCLWHYQQKLALLSNQLVNPATTLKQHNQTINHLKERLNASIRAILKHHSQRLMLTTRTLRAISPLATLERGYAIALKNDKVVNSITSVAIDETINIRMVDGRLDCLVTSKEKT
jgi:exodeoxyribonuclease VII large subunit